MKTISVHELARLQAEQPVSLIDVRMPTEFREVHAECAHNVPLDALEPDRAVEMYGQKNRPLYVICKSGGRSEMACKQLMAAGYDNVVSVDGGTEAWDRAGLPVIRGKKAVSLERQVRIVAGSLVLIGAVLAMVVNPVYAGLSAFIGAGLVFAGVTDTCGMGMMLAKMPWNRCQTHACQVK
ncbi:rhodanese-like domain-containing protein [Aporhodopirellula aestuarii]|uniref:Rhodanese-like domain-containing protein n=1 Tax=Aporhodopirellula aestuarii TaxID=2950107 RepID=A0ABT0U7R0_9BACT|nr:rhodanese-like domain-containing protein [Aporhodopirellula aestuarii]MCM2372916.1 rhodanese-like domain-containing protein [Aporhodopirellula aestuarii]